MMNTQHTHNAGNRNRMYRNDAQTDMLSSVPDSAKCVQRFDDSRSAIHTTFRSLLRSSSLREPRDPLLKVVIKIFKFISDFDSR